MAAKYIKNEVKSVPLIVLHTFERSPEDSLIRPKHVATIKYKYL